jgi:hypothetical protein
MEGGDEVLWWYQGCDPREVMVEELWQAGRIAFQVSKLTARQEKRTSE